MRILFLLIICSECADFRQVVNTEVGNLVIGVESGFGAGREGWLGFGN